MTVKIRDVAREAGVSVGAISRIINHDPSLKVTEETKELVWATVRKLDYRPLHYRHRKSAARKTLAAFIAYSSQDELVDPYWSSIRDGVELQTEQFDFEIVKSLRGDDNVFEFANDLEGKHIDGLLVTGNISAKCVKKAFPDIHHLVFISHRPRDAGYDSVWSDLGEATKNIINYLISMDYQKIGFMGGTDEIIDMDENNQLKKIKTIGMRHDSYCNYMKKLELYEEKYCHIEEGWDSETGYQTMKKILSFKDIPEAMIIASDMLAIGALSALQEEGLQVPDDMAIISFNNIRAATCMRPPLTTVHIPAKEIGRQAVKLLAEQFEGREYPVSYLLPTRLIIRGSCGGRPGNNPYERYVL